QPPRDLWLALGFDEEVNGRHGAKEIVKWFKEKEIRFESVLDEGGAVSDGSMIGIKEPVAVIGLAEKASASYEFIFTGEEGHSSTPPAHTSLGYMAEFIYKVERQPMQPRLTETVQKMLEAIAPHMPGIQSKILARPKLFFLLIKPTLLKNKQTAALLRSTVAFTVSRSGSAPNVLPKEASCTANLRILQGDTSADVLAHLRRVSGMDYQVRPIAVEEPSGVASTETAAYGHLTGVIGRLFPEAVIIPYLMAGGTDSRYYEELADHVYRFQPLRLTEAQLALMHGTDEHLEIDNLGRMMAFYRELITTLN
ncbi:MAG: M20/M25/M40 family metallo-hydrolase, partial [Clostridiaceae bacterium]|nr:M20/M25/M40 family metallo-hydrolase [Clostridiaceae bacterium]